MEEIKVNEKAVERLKRKIILQENQNLKTRTTFKFVSSQKIGI